MPVLTMSDLSAVQRPEFAQEVVMQTSPQRYPILAMLLSQGRVQPSDDRTVKVATDDVDVRVTAINNAADDYVAATTAIVVDSVDGIAADTLIRFDATGEVALVTGVTAATKTLTVVRGLGQGAGELGVAAAVASVADDAVVTILGPAKAEGADSPAAKRSAPSVHQTFMQIFRETVDISGTTLRTRRHTSNEPARQVERALQELSISIEHAFLYGAADAAIVGGGGTVSTCAGLLNAIETNSTDVNGNLTTKVWHEFASQDFEDGSQVKELWCGYDFLNFIHELYKDKVRQQRSERMAGFMFSEVDTPYGMYRLHKHPLMTGSQSAAAVSSPMDNLTARHTRQVEEIAGVIGVDDLPVDGRIHVRSIARQGADAGKWEAFAEMCLQWGSEKRMSHIFGVTGTA